MIHGGIDSVGVVSERSVRDSDVVIDADGATVCPGLIDSQVTGVPRFVGRSRNTPPTTRRVCVSENRVPQSYDTPRY